MTNFRLNQNHVSITTSTVMIRGETQTVGATMLGDIVCNQLLVSHLVATFCVGDHHDSHHGRYAVRASGSKKENDHVFSHYLTRQTIKADRARKNAHFVAWDEV